MDPDSGPDEAAPGASEDGGPRSVDTNLFLTVSGPSGCGATTVNAYLAEDSIADRIERGLIDGPLTEAVARYRKAIDQGLLKIMSKMGISVLASYRGAYNFEAVGLSRTLVDEFFPGMPSRISGIGLSGLQQKVLELHERAWSEDFIALPVGGFYKYRRRGERHSWDGQLIHVMQSAVASDSYSTFKKFSEGVRNLPPTTLRDLLDFNTKNVSPVSVEEVESITAIRKRFVTPGMSLGAMSPEAHKTLNIAMNSIGAKSDSGEGGEDPAHFKPDEKGNNPNSAIKQVASGRFGVTAEYLNNCREIEIKVAQGAKPGEGGQLPGFKVTDIIAKLRHATPGVPLISPPPHHDIYSIEDLAQLIYDLKQINPDAEVCVKLVARSGIGTIAAGVAKAKADVILIAGHSGGTGASPLTSIKYAGIPWEMGLSEVHQVLTLNRLRHRVKLRTDGGLKTGRDIVTAAILGAEEFGVGTASLVSVGCIMVRQCHSNTCPVGVCTQDPKLREKFTGTPQKVVNLFSFMAEEVREVLASLGARTLNEVIGRTELLHQVNRGAPNLDDLDLNPLLARPDPGGYATYCTRKGRNEVDDTLDAQMVEDARTLFTDGEKMQLQYTIRNTQRAIGSDVMMVLDECPAGDVSETYARESNELTLRWAARCKEQWTTTTPKYGYEQALFAIVQGVVYPDVRRDSARRLVRGALSSVDENRAGVSFRLLSEAVEQSPVSIVITRASGEIVSLTFSSILSCLRIWAFDAPPIQLTSATLASES